MPGLNLRTYGGVSARSSPGTTAANSTSATAAAFGGGATTSAPSMGAVLTPNDAFGTTFWIGVVSVGLLIFVRHSLPR